MTGEIVNLRRVRKAAARQSAQAKAAENRAVFGQSPAARKALEREAALARAKLDGHKRDDG